MIFAVPKLKQPIFRHGPIPIGSRTIHTHSFRLQVVDPKKTPVQGCLKFLPLRRVTQLIQNNRQPIITPIPFIYHLSSADFQGLFSSCHPALHPAQPVFPFRQNMRQPNDRCPAQTGPSPIPVGQKDFIQHFWNFHAFYLRQKNRCIVHSFACHIQTIGHPDSLHHFQNPVKI